MADVATVAATTFAAATSTLKVVPLFELNLPDNAGPADAVGSIDGAGRGTDSLLASLLMIFVSEIGDKTFLIAAIMAMQNSRMLIFSAACAALWLMSVLSAFLGRAVVNVVPHMWVSVLAAVMFWVFGAKMLKEAYDMGDDEIYQELEEVTAELDEKNLVREQRELEGGSVANSEKQMPTNAVAVDSLGGRDGDDGGHPTRKGRACCWSKSARNLMGLLLSPMFVETFVLIFLAEWGDRSQLATIALGAAKNVWGVVVGTIVGHTICTGAAVLGGRLLATRISVKKVTYAGGILFVIFGFLYLYEVYAEYQSN
ncbi:GCR1-dependent translation factor 1 [Spiromyces aspiralis]|uniref:GCR1-dependent translation factor 1 n=1 Tax=Spiromyces aspiralis TaxID=68401 RepID=A0ACC1HR43_9FUNG|nr:GCR1-dependent translation factor 1 [Spiromyces aspiralis]